MGKDMTLSKSAIRYEEDYNLWLDQTITALRAGRFEELDVNALIDELESMSKRDKREVLSRLKVLLMHLLKWQYQPNKRTASWEITIRNNREEIQQILLDSPSLKSYPVAVLEQAYASARQNASTETGLPISTFPEICPYEIATILSLPL
jgi:Domain of unknown function DUF29